MAEMFQSEHLEWTRKKLQSQMKLFQDPVYSWSNLIGHPLDSLVKAAVLVPLTVIDKELYIWLTERSQAVRNDKGHVAFPGGMKEAQDVNAFQTSLREAEEEIGLLPDQVEAVAELLPRINIRHNLITPVLGIVDSSFIPNPNVEVSRVFRLPLARFLSNVDHVSHRLSHLRDPVWAHLFNDHPAVVYGELVNASNTLTTWGLTASVCIEVACAVLDRPTEFNYYDDVPLLPVDPFLYRRRSLESATKMMTMPRNIRSSTASKL